MPHAKASETREIKRFCKRTRNYKKCIKEFKGYEKTKEAVKSDKKIEIEVIPYRY